MATSKSDGTAAPVASFGDDEYVIVTHGLEYSYKWSVVRKHPDWWIYKKIIEQNRIHPTGYHKANVCPEIYAYLHRYICYGVQLDIERIRRQLWCPKRVIIEDIKRHGFDPRVVALPDPELDNLDVDVQTPKTAAVKQSSDKTKWE